jgi:transposase
MGRPSSIDLRTMAVILCEEDAKKSQREICKAYRISRRTLRRWLRAYEFSGVREV